MVLNDACCGGAATFVVCCVREEHVIFAMGHLGVFCYFAEGNV